MTLQDTWLEACLTSLTLLQPSNAYEVRVGGHYSEPVRFRIAFPHYMFDTYLIRSPCASIEFLLAITLCVWYMVVTCSLGRIDPYGCWCPTSGQLLRQAVSNACLESVCLTKRKIPDVPKSSVVASARMSGTKHHASEYISASRYWVMADLIMRQQEQEIEATDYFEKMSLGMSIRCPIYYT